VLVLAILLEGGSLLEHINNLERNLKARIPKLQWCFVEPDTDD